MTVLRAAGGSGKTVAMAQWAEQLPCSGAWMTVEPDIGARLAFWGAISPLLAQFGVVVALPELCAVGEQPGGDDAVRSLLVRAFLLSSEPIVLVIDDAQNLSDPRIADDLVAVVMACRTVQLVIATRSPSRFEAPEIALSVDCALIGPDDVAFTIAEVSDVLAAGTVTSRDAAELHAATGGNALLLRALVHGDDLEPDSQRDRAQIAIREHWMTMTRADRALGQFCLDTAIPDDFDLQLARNLSGRHDIEEHVTTLEHEGLIMRTERVAETRFRFHPLVREMLRTECRRRSKSEFRRLSTVASVAAASRGHHLAALRHAVEVDNFELASSVLLRGGLTLIRTRGVGDVLRGTSIRRAAQYPLICFVLALSANARGERWRALELFALSLTASRATRPRQSPAERIVLDVVESVVLRVTGRAAESVTPARRALARIDRADETELSFIAPHIDALRVHCAIALLRAGALDEAADLARRLRAGSATHPDEEPRGEGDADEVSVRLMTMSLIAAVNAMRGRMPEADRALREIDSSGLPREVLDSYAGSLAHLARAIAGIEAGDMRRVRTHISALDAHMPTLEYRPIFSALRALALLWDGEAATALHELSNDQRRDAPRSGVSRADERLLSITRALLHAALSETGAAQEETRRLRDDDGLRLLLDAHLMLMGRRPELAFPVLVRIQPGESGERLRACRDLLLACAALGSGDRDAAATALRRYLSSTSASGLLSPLVLVPVELRDDLLSFGRSLGGGSPTMLERLSELPPIFRLARTRVSLTPREREILRALSTDSTHSDIAGQLGVAQNTLKAQTRTLYRKLAVGTRAEAVRVAYANGLLAVDQQPKAGGA